MLRSKQIVEQVHRCIRHRCHRPLSATRISRGFKCSQRRFSEVFDGCSKIAFGNCMAHMHLLTTYSLLAGASVPVGRVIQRSKFPDSRAVQKSFSHRFTYAPDRCHSHSVRRWSEVVSVLAGHSVSSATMKIRCITIPRGQAGPMIPRGLNVAAAVTQDCWSSLAPIREVLFGSSSIYVFDKHFPS